MENRQIEFLKAVDNNVAYDFIANHYMEFPKDELKDIILELLYLAEGRDKITPQMQDFKVEIESRWDY